MSESRKSLKPVESRGLFTKFALFDFCPAMALTLAAWSMLSGCNHRNANSDAPPASESREVPATKADAPPPAADAPKPLPPEPDDQTRWLFAEAAADSTKGGWIEGSFDALKNKIEIRTKDTARFRIDTSRMPINWDKLVIMNIDGKGAELRRRENPVIRFEHDGASHWKVME